MIYSNLGGLEANKNSPDFVLCKALFLFFVFVVLILYHNQFSAEIHKPEDAWHPSILNQCSLRCYFTKALKYFFKLSSLNDLSISTVCLPCLPSVHF